MLEVHTQTAVPVAASEDLGQLVVQVEAWGRPPLSLGCPPEPRLSVSPHSDSPGKTHHGGLSHLSNPSSASPQLCGQGQLPSLLWASVSSSVKWEL